MSKINKKFVIHGRVMFSKKFKRRIFKRDGNKCKNCGFDKTLTVDHIIPLAQGGSNRDNNLQTLCHRCNQEKAANIHHQYIRI